MENEETHVEATVLHNLQKRNILAELKKSSHKKNAIDKMSHELLYNTGFLRLVSIFGIFGLSSQLLDNILQKRFRSLQIRRALTSWN